MPLGGFTLPDVMIPKGQRGDGIYVGYLLIAGEMRNVGLIRDLI